MVPDAFRRGDPQPLQLFEGIDAGTGVGRAGAGSDGTWVVADDIGNDQCQSVGSLGRLRQLATRQAGEMLAHGVDVVDVGAGM